ncbi:MAG: hypothetical protein E7474_14090 [Ruminococcaceae bacterium]|nr:hypothetical protein [Oscillospiraceae bacterium]
MNKTYRVGKRFRRLEYFSVTINCLIVFVFFFIYRFLLSGVFPGLSDTVLAAVFLLLGAVVAKLTMKFAERYAAGIGYRVTDEGLTIISGARERQLAWKDFTAARLVEFQFRGVFPVQFQTAGETLTLNQYLDGLCELTGIVLERIAPYAELEPGLMEQAKKMNGVY